MHSTVTALTAGAKFMNEPLMQYQFNNIEYDVVGFFLLMLVMLDFCTVMCALRRDWRGKKHTVYETIACHKFTSIEHAFLVHTACIQVNVAIYPPSLLVYHPEWRMHRSANKRETR